MARQGYTILSYAFLFEEEGCPFLRWLAYELGNIEHPIYELAERLAKAKNREEQKAVCRSSNRQELNFLVSKIRFFLAVESLRKQQGQEDDLLIKALIQKKVGPEVLRFIRLAKNRLEKKALKKSSDFHFLYDWTNWEQHYLTLFLPKDRNAQNLTPKRIKVWIEGLELELMHLGTHYLYRKPSNPQINQLLDWLQSQEASLSEKPALYLFQKLRDLWQYLPERGIVQAELEEEVIAALYAAAEVLHQDYFANLYIQTLNFFIRKSQCSSQYKDYLRLFTLYEWGLEKAVFSMNRQFLLSISNTLLSLAELSQMQQKKEWLDHCENFVEQYHLFLPEAEQQQCRQYIETHINFLNGDFDGVILPSSTDKMEDPHYSLLSFFMSLQVWYEKNELAWVRSLLNKKKKATTEWKRLGPKAKEMLRVRIDIFSLLLRAKSIEKLDELEQEIKKPRPLEGRVWFLQKLERKRQLL